MLSSMRLDDFKLGELVIEANPQFDREAQVVGELPINLIDFDGSVSEEERCFTFVLIIDLGAREATPNLPLLHVRVVVVGSFSFGKDASAELIEKVTPQNQLSALYGFARGIVANATALTPSGPYLLPSVNFYEIVKAKLAADSAGTTDNAPKSKAKSSADGRVSKSPG